MRKIIDALYAVIFPRRCLGCGKIGQYICISCRSKLSFINIPICPVCTRPAIDGATHPRCKTRYTIDGLTSVFRYTGSIRKSIKFLKYRRVRDVAPLLSELVVKKIKDSDNEMFKSLMIRAIRSEKPIIVPIPLHWIRKKKRWFNQSELIAHDIASMFDLEVDKKLLIRTKQKQSQTSLIKADRIKNMKGVFKIVNQKSKNQIPKSVILVDDVWTTGATMREASNMLKRAGVKCVWGLTVAR